MAVIFAASSIPNLTQLPGGISDKSGHSIGYAMLGGFFSARLRGRPAARRHLEARRGRDLLHATYLRVSDEFHQLFVPGRSADRL